MQFFCCILRCLPSATTAGFHHLPLQLLSFASPYGSIYVDALPASVSPFPRHHHPPAGQPRRLPYRCGTGRGAWRAPFHVSFSASGWRALAVRWAFVLAPLPPGRLPARIFISPCSAMLCADPSSGSRRLRRMRRLRRREFKEQRRRLEYEQAGRKNSKKPLLAAQDERPHPWRPRRNATLSWRTRSPALLCVLFLSGGPL